MCHEFRNYFTPDGLGGKGAKTNNALKSAKKKGWVAHFPQSSSEEKTPKEREARRRREWNTQIRGSEARKQHNINISWRREGGHRKYN